MTVKTRDGRKAVDLAREHKPDLIIADIQLPEISGLKVTQREERQRPRGHPRGRGHGLRDACGDEQRIRAGGCEAYLSKPISVSSFMETVRRFIG